MDEGSRSAFREAVGEALRSQLPEQSLEAVVRRMLGGGQSRDVIGTELDELVDDLRGDSEAESAEVEVVLEVLDRLRGWCAPSARL